MTREDWWNGRLLTLDTETTGTDPRLARCVSAYAAVTEVDPDTGERLKTWEHDVVIDPGVDVPDGAAAVHGWTTERVREHGTPAAAAIPALLEAVARFTVKLPLVVMNAPYDLTVLRREAMRHNVKGWQTPGVVLDPLVIDKHLHRYRRGKRQLGVLAAHYGVPLSDDDAHAASADALAAVGVLRAMLNEQQERGTAPPPAAVLARLQRGWRAEQVESLEDYFRRTKDGSITLEREWPSLPWAPDLEDPELLR